MTNIRLLNIQTLQILPRYSPPFEKTILDSTNMGSLNIIRDTTTTQLNGKRLYPMTYEIQYHAILNVTELALQVA